MKKILCVILMCGLLLTSVSGCAQLTKGLSFLVSGMTFVEQKVCPTNEMAKEAFVAAGFLAAFPMLQSAYAVFDWLSKGLCVANSQLLQAIKDYDSVPAPTLKGVGAVKPEINRLRSAVK